MKADTRLFRFGDVVIYLLLIALCAILFMQPLLHDRNGPLTAELIVDGKTAEEIDLSALKEPLTRETRGCRIVFSSDGVRFLSADCPDKLCEKTGEIRLPGESIACVPNRVAVTLKRQGAFADYDMVAY